MNVDQLERHILETVSGLAFIQQADTIDKTRHALKMRLHVTSDCFIQVYANVQKQLFSYALVVNRSRIYGCDSEGGLWHRYPRGAPETHVLIPEGAQPVSLVQFLSEAQSILQGEGIL